MTKRDNSEDFLHSTQESAATNQTTSSAGQDLSRRQREAAGTIARSSRKPRRSGRLQIPASSGVADPPHTHGYHTRSQPLSERQLRKAHGNPIPLPKSELSSPSVPIGRKQKGYSRLSAKQKAKKQEAEETRQDRSDRMVRRLEDDNPLDELSMDMKKRLASYLVLKDVFGAQSNGERADIEARVADMLGFSARTVSAWSREYELAERLAETLTLRGKHPKTRSPIVNPEFEDFRQRLRTFVRTEAVGKGGKPNLTIKAITQWINEELDLDHDTGYSERTVSRWLELLDFKVVTVKKTLYVECSKAVSARSEGKLKCVFLTHRSPIHCKMAEDALNVRLMNVRPGGKQPKMRDGWFWEDGQKKVQSMVFPSDHSVYPGLPKGLRQVCTERFGAEAVGGLKHEALVDLLKDCEDFQSQPTLLQDEAEARGDLIIYGVKFHPELAPIEAAYRSIAKALRVANSATSSVGFKARVAESQDPPDLSLVLIRKHFRSAREYLQLYTEGKTLEQIESLRKLKRKHRGAAPQLGEAGECSESSIPGKYPRFRL